MRLVRRLLSIQFFSLDFIQTYKNLLAIILGLTVAFLLTHNIYFLYPALVLAICGMISEHLAAKISWVWEKISEVLGKISAAVLLSVIFFGVLTPLSIIRKLFQKKAAIKTDSNFITVAKSADEESFHRQW